jgi:hypothetical protein
MTDNIIFTNPKNKCFDEYVRYCDAEESEIYNDNSENAFEKVCFNPYCNNRGSRLIQTSETVDDYRDHPACFVYTESVEFGVLLASKGGLY